MKTFTSTWTIFTLGLAAAAVFTDEGDSNDFAWRGWTSPGSREPHIFRPYYVPTGSKSFDDGDIDILYQGDWSTVSSNDYVGGSLHRTRGTRAQVTLAFSGTGIEWFGTTGPDHGRANMFLDGQWVEQITTHDKDEHPQQRLWGKRDLIMGAHELRIVNVPTRGRSQLDVDAFVVLGDGASSSPPSTIPGSNSTDKSSTGNLTTSWTLVQNGESGVSAMQLAVISPTRALVVDKVEHNLISIDGHPAWAAIYDFVENKAYPIEISSNSFCAGGTFLSNGTMINVGGNPVVEDHTNSADFGDLNGLQGLRILEHCHQESSPDNCLLYENHDRIRMASPRWYNTVVRLPDGSAMIIGGSKSGGWINNATANNPTYEFFPPKGDGLAVDLQFLKDTLNSNLFPIAFVLPDGRMFVAANQDAMIYDWQSKTEQRLPQIPNGQRVTYPMSGTGVLLPLDPTNNYVPEMLICGGSTLNDTTPGYELDSQSPASDQCVRMVLTDDGIASGWTVEHMPQPRLMGDAVLLPTGNVFFVNGCGSGVAGYGNVKNQVGASNADNPVFTPTLYSTDGPEGSRFSTDGMPTSDIPRMYHSTATLLPDGHILVAGSNPNLDRSTQKYQTEYRVEHIYPPYMNASRPTIDHAPPKLRFGESYDIAITIPSDIDFTVLKVSLMDFGYVTHATHANSRLVYLDSDLSPDGQTLTITAPPNENIYPPGPGWIFVVADGIPSVGEMVMVGDGQDPPVDQAAIDNLLKHTS